MVLEDPKLGSSRGLGKLISATIPSQEKETLKLSTIRSTDQVGMASVPTSGDRAEGKSAATYLRNPCARTCNAHCAETIGDLKTAFSSSNRCREYEAMQMQPAAQETAVSRSTYQEQDPPDALAAHAS